MQRYFDVVQNDNGRAVPNATITVRTAGVVNPLPNIFQAGGSRTAPASLNNPFTTDPYGNYAFAAPNGTYDIVITGGGIPTKILPNINFYDAADASASPALGTVTDVSLSMPAEFTVSGSPVTTSGTLAVAKATQVANTFYSGPSTGADAQPGFRAMVTADLPNAGSAGTYGSASLVPIITTNAKGQVTGVTTAAPAPAWGRITGTLSNQTDLQTALNSKANVGSAVNFTGDVRWSITSTAQTGWILADGKTIGDASSNGTGRANADTIDLFTLIWNEVAIDYCPVVDATGAPVAKGASAAADFALHYAIALPDLRGRTLIGTGSGVWQSRFTADAATDVITLSRAYPALRTGLPFFVNSTATLPAGLSATTYFAIRVSDTSIRLSATEADAVAGTYVNITSAGTGTHTASLNLTARPNGQVTGEEAHLLTSTEIPAHAHNAPTSGGVAGVYEVPTGAWTIDYSPAAPTSVVGSSASHGNMQPCLAMYAWMKL